MDNKELGRSPDGGGLSPSVEPVPVSPAVAASIPSAVVIEELLAHLGATRMQMVATDDAIIASHIHAAHALALMLFRGTRK